jgi:hypothetical protein
MVVFSYSVTLGEFMLTVKASSLLVDTKGFKGYAYTSDLRDETSGRFGPGVRFLAGRIRATATVTIDSAATDGAGYQLGFTQFISWERSRGYYRGLKEEDGSLIVEQWSANQPRLCHDIDAESYPFIHSGKWRELDSGYPCVIDLATVPSFAAPLNVAMSDTPNFSYWAAEKNEKTRKDNYLILAGTVLHFCTLLMLRRPDGSVQQLQHFFWHASWIADFYAEQTTRIGDGLVLFDDKDRPVVFTLISNRNTSVKADSVIAGEVRDPRFAHIGDKIPRITNCKEIFEARPNVWSHPNWDAFRPQR